MKRSSMIYQLAGFICDIHNGYIDSWTSQHLEEAEELLELIEKAGMIPPITKSTELELDKLIEESEHVNGRIYDTENILGHIKWEPENEEK